jgi:uncharacterized membrane protein (UPF0127 family)
MFKLFGSMCVLFLVIGLYYYLGHIGLTYNKVYKLDSQSLQLEVVNTPESMRKGLSDRVMMCEKCGMLFEFPEENIYPFWMKDMKYDLDIIYLNKDAEVVEAFENVTKIGGEASSVTNSVPAKYVLELNSGAFSKFGFALGSRLSL